MSTYIAHLVRELTYLQEQEQLDWAGRMKAVLLGMHEAAQKGRVRGASVLPPLEHGEWGPSILRCWLRDLPAPEKVPKRGGRRKQTSARNLLDDLLWRADQVQAFLDDLSLPSPNNQARRDLLQVKVQQKISGTFRSEDGATAFCRIRNYLSSGHAMLAAFASTFTCRLGV